MGQVSTSPSTMPHVTKPEFKYSSSSFSLSTPVSSISSLTKTESFSNLKYDKKAINNGVIGEYLSLTVAKAAYSFWKQNIDCLKREEQLEIGCSIYFSMMTSGKEMQTILWNHAKSGPANGRVERLGLQLVDMMGWFARQLLTHNINLKSAFAQLGIRPKALGINASHFAVMLSCVHETFAYYFKHKYSIKEQYAVDKLFAVAVRLMMNENLSEPKMDDVRLDFLESLTDCLKSDAGKAYLYRYFQQTFCDELVIYLKSMQRYKAATSDKERFMIARDICKASIKATAPFAINISYDARQAALGAIKQLEREFLDPSNKKEFKVPSALFDECEKEIARLIRQNHWVQFKAKITMLRNIS